MRPRHHKLTTLQQQLVRWRLEGLSARLIAERRGCSERTIEHHFYNIYRILNVKKFEQLRPAWREYLRTIMQVTDTIDEKYLQSI